MYMKIQISLLDVFFMKGERKYYIVFWLKLHKNTNEFDVLCNVIRIIGCLDAVTF